MTRRPLLAATVVLALCFVPVLANADAVTFQLATTTGCFSSGCTNYAANPIIYGSNNIGSLAFVGLPTSSTPANSSGSLQVLLGTFTFGDGPGPGSSSGGIGEFDTNFTALITFILPATIANGNPTSFTATVDGTAKKNKSGSVDVDFDNTARLFSFSNSSYTGSFYFSVGDVTNLDITQTGNRTVSQNWYGQITTATQEPVANPVPEPASMLLLGTGLLGGIGALRRRVRR